MARLPRMRREDQVRWMVELFESRHTGPHRAGNFYRTALTCPRCALEEHFALFVTPEQRQEIEDLAAAAIVARDGKAMSRERESRANRRNPL